ncbi:heterokaryon incompatibility protein-domain-containing protein [Hyaloscypha finlandica]|nr:heterokaryon incompatibility protein-domain-containing protein [Hyaloscypha finlandica]
MASNPTPSGSDMPVPDLANLQSLLRAALALGVVSPDEEIEARSQLANRLILKYDRGGPQRNTQDLRDAIEHSDAVLRRLPRDSPTRLPHLNRLSYAHMSEYTASRSRRALDEAVACGRLARLEAAAAGLPENDMELYCDILNNVGVALSYRGQYGREEASEASSAPAAGGRNASAADLDLDEAIGCAREMQTCTRPGTERHAMALLNLASRLKARGDPASHAEAVDLLRQLQVISPPGSVSGLATMQLGQMAVAKYQKSDVLEDLDDALRQMREGMDVMPEGSELRPQYLNLVTVLYSKRYKKVDDVADLRNAVRFSHMALAAVPASHGVRSGYLVQHMRLLRDFVNATASVQEVSEATLEANQHLTNMPREYRERHDCRTLYGEVLGRKYTLSRELEDLDAAVHHIVTVCYDYNARVEQSGTRPQINTSIVYGLSSNVRKLSRAPSGPVRDAGAKNVYDQIATACKSHDFVNGLLSIRAETVTLLGIYADAACSKEAISDEDAQKRATEIELHKATELEDRRSRTPRKPEDYQTELGLRSLAMDPTNKRVVMDLSGLMTDILGYDPSEPVSHTEFVARQARLEKESIEKAKADGKHPNPKLCHMCRLVKPLSLTTETTDGRRAFTWNPEGSFLPFGTWHQLKQRQHCSICRLVLSLITTDPVTNNLHPRLAAIDREIQGVQLRASEVQASGEVVLTVEYGMREVGELRIATERNYTSALRQGWEAREQHHEFGDLIGSAHNQDGQAGRVNGPLHSATGQQVNPSLLGRWLNDCELNHGGACNRSHSHRGERSDTVINLAFIDVIDNCLVSATSAVKYFALSYVWGTVDMSPTLLANYESRCQKGGLPPQLPHTIADTIVLVRALGERYLWVDALCIVQDNPENKMRDIARMDVIYSRAFATVVALRGASADAGLPGVRPGTRYPQQVEPLVVNAGDEDLDCNPGPNSDPDRELVKGKEKVTLHLVATPTPLHLALETSRWDTRGWTFQERLLSRRCLYFADRYVYFQCSRHVLSECGVNGPVRGKQRFWDYNDGKKTLTAFLENPLSDLHHGELTDLTPELRRAKAFAGYVKLVEKYTTRKLSHDADIINAFLGTFAVLNASFQSDIFCGLPAAALDLALLWAPAARLSRRGSTLGLAIRQNIEGKPALGHLLPTNRGTVLQIWGPAEQQTFDQNIDRRFPSWSWVGWVGAVEYRLFAEMRPEEPPPKSLIKEFAINMDGKALQTIPGRKQQRVPSLDDSPSTSATRYDTAISLANLHLNDPDAENKPIASPSLPNILQFLAPTVPLSAFTISTQCEYISALHHIHASGQQAVRHILDRAGARCGLWWEQAGYVYIGRGVSAAAERKMLLVGVSQHHDTFRARTGPSRAEGEIRLFDPAVYPEIGPGSGLVNVLAVDLDMGHEFGERITVARIHARAWEEAGPVMKMVRLA